MPDISTVRAPSASKAEAEFKSAPEKNVVGEATFTQASTGVQVHIQLDSAPRGIKGIHIHESDDCSAIANKSMGGHFNPTGASHALPPNQPRHLGDLGNIEIDEQGKGTLDTTVPGATLKEGEPLSLVGKAVVLHESQDQGTGEAGNAGSPIACAPIKAI